MFHLVVVVCMAGSACETLRAPLPYPSETRCAAQAAILAGVVRGGHRPGRAFTYEYTCTANPKAVAAWGEAAPK